MGKIKTKIIKRTARELIKRGVKFGDDFEENKTILGKTMPSKKIRNQIAGFIAKFEKQKK